VRVVCPPPVGIGLSDLPNIGGGAVGPLAPSQFRHHLVVVASCPALLPVQTDPNSKEKFKILKNNFQIIAESFYTKAMKSSPLLELFCGSEFWGFSLLKI